MFEYKIIDDQKDGSPDSEFELNELGKEGWELVSVLTDYIGGMRWYFKRRILTQQSSGHEGGSLFPQIRL